MALFAKQNKAVSNTGAGRIFRDHATLIPHLVGGDSVVQRGEAEVRQPIEVATSTRAMSSTSYALDSPWWSQPRGVLGTGFTEPDRHRTP